MFIRSPKSVYRHLFDLLIRFLVEIIIYYQSVIIRFIEKNGSSSRKVIFHSLKRNCKIQFGVSSFFYNLGLTSTIHKQENRPICRTLQFYVYWKSRRTDAVDILVSPFTFFLSRTLNTSQTLKPIKKK